MVSFVLVANPQSRRVEFFQRALAQFGLPPARLVPYEALLAGRCTLDTLTGPETWVRFEAPERNFGVVRSLIAAGAESMTIGPHQTISAWEAEQLPEDLGRIYYPQQWYLGWQKQLQAWNTQIQGQSLNSPEDIIAMFDKPRCQTRLAQNGIPVPPPVMGDQPLQDSEQLRDRMAQQGCKRVFVKLAHGSSASGVVAYERRGDAERAITSVERVMVQGELKFYNSRKIRQYRNAHEIADILNFVIREQAQVEVWMPKARLKGREFDVRIVVIGGQARQGVVRVGNSPMTNLQLGNDRRPLTDLPPQITAEVWSHMMQTCEQAAACFPHSFYCGVDLLIAPNYRDHFILELNAFGDLLPTSTWQGQTTYETEIDLFLRQQGIQNKV
ncbi:MAG: STM4014 family protein, partial [Thermosynechococcaceae cyanobacterium]